MRDRAKRVLARTLWLAKGATLFWGSALTVAVVLGAATTALAAVPGDPLRLGQTNVVNAISRLVGNVAGGPTLLVDNNSGAVGARALDLRVEQGRAPLTVNSDAGKAPNLDADQLDGKDSTAFLGADDKAESASNADFATSAADAQNSQIAADAALLGGKDDTAYFSGKVYDRDEVDVGPGNGFSNLVVAQCDAGDVALGGGGDLAELEPNTTDDLIASGPGVASSGRSWFARFRDVGAANAHRVFVRCADFPPLRP